MRQSNNKFLFPGLVVIGSLFCFDQYCKNIFAHAQKAYSFGIVSFSFFSNEYLAFSIPLKGRILIGFIFTLICVIFVIGVRSFVYGRSIEALMFCCIFAGAVSNFIDRVTHGYVIDYIHVWILPVFNIADMMICFGSAWIIWKKLFRRREGY